MFDLKNATKSSLIRKILITSVSALLVLAVVLGAVGCYIVDRLADTDSQKIMTQLCEKETLRFDNKLNMVQHSVETICEYANDLQRINGNMDVYSDAYEQHVKEFAISVANQTSGAMAVYFRYNPEVTGSGTDGFFWSRVSDNEHFKEEKPTDILAYNSSDVEHVGWFYTPKETGKPLWMTPYYNKNLKVFMISYTTPLYLSNGEFAGVIGMDIDFKTIISETRDDTIYESGSVALVDLKERLIYYSDSDGLPQSDKLSNALYNHITTINKSNELLEITDRDGVVSVICCMKLSNGMIMYVNVPKKEIDRGRISLMVIFFIISILIFAFSSAVISHVTTKMVHPLERLTSITKQYAQGDWSCQYISDTGDEIQRLSEGISQMAANTQQYIEMLDKLAHTDAITGLGNRRAYLEKVSEIKDNLNGKYDEYALVSMDLNMLKAANDTYGHEAGDLLIREAADYVMGIFAQSCVYRTGGDEFVAILNGDDYTNRDKLLKVFENGMNYSMSAMPQVILSISFGMAEVPEDGTDFESIFKLADERMYRKKKEMKESLQDWRQK